MIAGFLLAWTALMQPSSPSQQVAAKVSNLGIGTPGLAQARITDDSRFDNALAGSASLKVTYSDGELRLDGLPRVFEQEEVIEALDSGLTTTFVVRLAGRGSRRSECAATTVIQVRYDLWTEKFRVKWTELLGSGATELGDRGALSKWWGDRSLSCEVANLDNKPYADVDLMVVPFSQDEGQDARRWFSRSLTSGRSPGASGSSLLQVVLSSSIRSDSVAKFAWRVNLAPRN